jgi:hypothetical protein
MFLFPKRAKREAWESNKKERCSSGNWRQLRKKERSLFIPRVKCRAADSLAAHQLFGHLRNFLHCKVKVPRATLITPLFTLIIYKNHNIKMNLHSNM